MNKLSPQQWQHNAYTSYQAGDGDATRKHLSDAIKQHPNDSHIWNTAGDLHLKMGDAVAAQTCFAKAASLAPDNFDFSLNHAIALSTLERHREAIAALQPFEKSGRTSAVYCSARGTAERGVGDSNAAAAWYDRAIALDPARAKALHGRARVAIERGERDAVQRVDQALSQNQGDADLWLAKAQALDVAGDVAQARQITEQIVQQAPAWIEGLKFLAQLRLGAGERDFASHFDAAWNRAPQDPNIAYAWCSVLAGLDHNAEAADVAARAQSAFPEIEHFRLLEAIYSGAAGNDDLAEGIFSSLELQAENRWLHEARHQIRRQELDRAQGLLDQIFAVNPWDISTWALQGVVWRLTGNSRADWLCGQPGLVSLKPLANAEAFLPDAISFLHELHDGSPLPLGQSLRGGSQTRGILFNRTEPLLAQLHQAILQTLEQYRAELPAADETHPLLRHRDTPWRLAGSWSVRLAGGGDYHTAHIHPQGIVSSALYLEFPSSMNDDPMAGALEVGRPAPDLRTGLDPIRTIEPKIAHLALFPSILYHGTRPFTGENRMTVAFDVVTRQNVRQ